MPPLIRDSCLIGFTANYNFLLNPHGHVNLGPFFIVLQNMGEINWRANEIIYGQYFMKIKFCDIYVYKIYLQSQCKMLATSFQPLNWSSPLVYLLTIIQPLYPSITFSANTMSINQLDSLNLRGKLYIYIQDLRILILRFLIYLICFQKITVIYYKLKA